MCVQDQYLSSRSTAIETIESTVAELGQIFSQLAHMVAVQGEQVTRIDADTEDIAANVTGAQSCVFLSNSFESCGVLMFLLAVDVQGIAEILCERLFKSLANAQGQSLLPGCSRPCESFDADSVCSRPCRCLVSSSSSFFCLCWFRSCLLEVTIQFVRKGRSREVQTSP